MKKRIFLTVLIGLLSLTACNGGEETYQASKRDLDAIDTEIELTYNYFMDTTNYSNGSAGFGLTQDRYSNKSMCSVAATGFLLASYPVFVKAGLMEKETAYDYSLKTITTLINIQNDSSTSYQGCLSHFVNKVTGKRFGNSEVSTIDTALAVSGALVAGCYFEDDVYDKAIELWKNVNFNAFDVKYNGKSYISMGIENPTATNKVQLGKWDYYAEHLMIYILGVGNPNENHRIGSKYYQNMTKNVGSYGGHSFVHSWFGSLFTYQFSQAFFDFRSYNDNKGRNYFTNSVEASLAAYQYCVDNAKRYNTFSEVSWGLTACDAPTGYNGNLGNPPRGYGGDAAYARVCSTIAPCGALGSMPFTPKQSIKALHHYQSDDRLNHAQYGLKDAYNLDYNGTVWYDTDFIGIDKGITVLQLANYRYDNFVSELTNKCDFVKEGFENTLFSYVGE